MFSCYWGTIKPIHKRSVWKDTFSFHSPLWKVVHGCTSIWETPINSLKRWLLYGDLPLNHKFVYHKVLSSLVYLYILYFLFYPQINLLCIFLSTPLAPIWGAHRIMQDCLFKFWELFSSPTWLIYLTFWSFHSPFHPCFFPILTTGHCLTWSPAWLRRKFLSSCQFLHMTLPAVLKVC